MNKLRFILNAKGIIRFQRPFGLFLLQKTYLKDLSLINY